MPELPEVESVVRTLLPHVEGRRVIGARWIDFGPGDLTAGRSGVFKPARGEWLSQLTAATIVRVRRRGKRIVFEMTPAKSGFYIHLGMTGRIEVLTSPPDSPLSRPHAPLRPHTHLILYLNDGREVHYSDPRRFGHVVWDGAGAAVDLGAEPLTMRRAALLKAMVGQRAIKAVLLDQTRVAGLGNIYVDESLFAAGIHPLSPAGQVTPEQATELMRHIKRILRRAIKAGGSTLRDYVDANGRLGSYKSKHKVYGRAGQPCTVCRRKLVGAVIAGRTTVFCSRCQPPET